MSPARPHLVVSFLLVMGCANIERCRLIEHQLVQRGFQMRPASDDGGHICTRSFVREHSSGSANDVLDHVCEEVEGVFSPDVPDWKAFIQVSGDESAWATLQAGKPRLLGRSTLPGTG